MALLRLVGSLRSCTHGRAFTLRPRRLDKVPLDLRVRGRSSQRRALLLERIALGRTAVTASIVVVVVVAVVVVLLALLVLRPEVANPQAEEPAEVALACLDRELALRACAERWSAPRGRGSEARAGKGKGDAQFGAAPR